MCLEHKLLADYWLEFLGSGGRKTVAATFPLRAHEVQCRAKWQPIPLGKATVLSARAPISPWSALGVSLHRCMEAATLLEQSSISCGVIDLRSVSPLDVETLRSMLWKKPGACWWLMKTTRAFGLSGELAAIILEAGIRARYVTRMHARHHPLCPSSRRTGAAKYYALHRGCQAQLLAIFRSSPTLTRKISHEYQRP